MQLRDYQLTAKQDCYDIWAKNPKANILLRIPTGGGKTKTFCSIVSDLHTVYPTAIMVHRKELVQQICLTLAELGLEHNIIAPVTTIRTIISNERTLFKRSFYNHRSSITVLSVDTLIARAEVYKDWVKQIRFWVCDEAAHLLRDNKWGKAVALFTNAFGLGVTATPERLDRKGLGSHADGVFDAMVSGPSTRNLIGRGFLSKYMLDIPESDYKMYLKDTDSDADFSKQAMLEASRNSRIVGDIVKNFKKHNPRPQSIVFADSKETGLRLEQEFNKNGIPAKLLTADNSDSERFKTLEAFKRKEIIVLINIDLFDEGLDVPGIDCVIMGRPTKSLGKFLQMVGRGLRVAEGKEYMILVDHVGNLGTHGLPDAFRRWTLDRKGKRKAGKSLTQFCSSIVCNRPFERVLSVCPFCQIPVPKPSAAANGEGGGRTALQMVDGDLMLLDPDVLRALEVSTILEDPGVVAERVSLVNPMFAKKAMADQIKRIEEQKRLALAIAHWAGPLKEHGYDERMMHKQFFLEFDLSVPEALSLRTADMEYVRGKIEKV